MYRSGTLDTCVCYIITKSYRRSSLEILSNLHGVLVEGPFKLLVEEGVAFIDPVDSRCIIGPSSTMMTCG